MGSDFALEVPISFGHCDPAGIVFYPNYFRWFDRCFHTFLQERGGGHKALCAELGAVGIGLMDVGARFTAPAREGDRMMLHMTIASWEKRSLRAEYRGMIADRQVVLGHEVRGVFVMQGDAMKGASVEPLKQKLSMT